MKKFLRLVLILVLVPYNIAQAEEIPTFNKEAFIESSKVNKTLEIGMADCVAMALRNNSEILVKKISPLIEKENVRIEKSRFDPEFTFDFTTEDNTELSSVPSLTVLTTTKTKTTDFNFGYNQELTTGTLLDINFYNTRTRSNSALQRTNPQLDSELEFKVTQPLLKGFGTTATKTDFLIAKNNKLKADQDFIKEVIKILTDVKEKYYSFQYAQEEYRVAQSTLKRVESLDEINREKYSKGLVSNVELLESGAEVARAEQSVLASEASMKLAEDNLKLVTNIVDDPRLWNANIVLLDVLGYEEKKADLTDSLQEAFKLRPDYKEAIIDLKNKDISVVFYRNNMLPTLDLSGSYGLNGLAKTYEKDLAHIGGGKYPNWNIGVSVKVPFFGDEEKGEYRKSKLEKRQALISFKRLEQQIILEVRDAVRNVDIVYRTLGASKRVKEAEEENYAAQEERFKAGLVSTLDILIYQERLARAEVGYVKSVIDYNITLLKLAKAKGSTLFEGNIKVE